MRKKDKDWYRHRKKDSGRDGHKKKSPVNAKSRWTERQAAMEKQKIALHYGRIAQKKVKRKETVEISLHFIFLLFIGIWFMLAKYLNGWLQKINKRN